MDEQMKVRFVGDASSLETASEQSTAALDKVTAATSKVSQSLQQASQRMAQSAASMGGSLGKVHQHSSNATFALTNLGRVAQDLPYGFIGIANNLNPLLESFQRVQKEAGGTGAALKLIARDMLGAGGLGLALSVVTAALQFASIGLSMWGRGLKSAGSQAKETTDQADVLKSAFKDIAQEASKVEVLVAALKQGNLTYAERKGAIEELKRIAPSYFAQLDAEKLNIDTLNLSYKNYLGSLKNAAEAKVLEKQLEGIIEKRLELEKVLNPPQFTFDEQGRKIQNFVLVTAATQKIRNQNQAEYNNLLKGEEVLSSRLAQLKPKDIIVPDFKTKKDKTSKTEFLFEFLPFDPSGKLKPEQQGQLNDAIDKFSKEFEGIFKGVNFNALSRSPQEKIKLALQFDADLKAGNVKFDLSKIKEATDKAIKDVDVIPESTVGEIDASVVDKFIRGFQNASETLKNKNLFGDLTLNDSQVLDLFKTKFQQIGSKLPKMIESTDAFGNKIMIPVRVGVKFQDLDKAFNEAKAKLEVFKGQITDAFSALGQGVGAAAATGNLKSLFAPVFNVISSYLEKLGEATIATGIAMLGLKKALEISFANPIAQIGAGVALVAASAFVKAKLAGIKAFAQGGLAFGPTLGLVGEGIGTSRSNPEVIAPLDKLKDFINPNSGSVAMPMGDWKIRGKDLVFVMAQTQKSQRRAT